MKRMDKPLTDQASDLVAMSRMENDRFTETDDLVTIEAPLQIVLRHGPRKNRQITRLAMTMRTPGQDDILALGYLYTENIIDHYEDVLQIRHLQENEILLDLKETLVLNLENQERNTYVNSSCGVCGKTHLDEIKSTVPFILQTGAPVFSSTDIRLWPALLTDAQKVFSLTGGIHAAALISGQQVLAVCEDIGRHNAVDKLIGHALSRFTFPLKDYALMVSSRASFELVQKALMTGLPILAAVGATSSLAIELARENNMTLIAFLKENRFNIYSGSERVVI